MPYTETKRNLPSVFRALALITLIVSILGYIDFRTGEISIDLLYILCICLVTWHTNTLLGLLCVIEIVVSKATADYFCLVKVGTHLYEWNAFNDIIIYVLVCLLVDKLKKALTT